MRATRSMEIAISDIFGEYRFEASEKHEAEPERADRNDRVDSKEARRNRVEQQHLAVYFYDVKKRICIDKRSDLVRDHVARVPDRRNNHCEKDKNGHKLRYISKKHVERRYQPSNSDKKHDLEDEHRHDEKL